MAERMKPQVTDAKTYFERALSLLKRNDLEAADAEMRQLWLQHTEPEMHREYAKRLEEEARRLTRKGKREEATLYNDARF
jgi:hypothetical protein